MLVEEDSPLRRLPVNLNQRQMLFLGGIRHSLEMIDLAYEHLVSALALIGDSHSEGSDGEVHPYLNSESVMMAWSLVDSMNRLRVLLENMPGVKQKAPHHQVLLRRLKTIEQLRNPIQHLDSELTARAKEGTPTAVWGALAWVHADEGGSSCTSCILIPGSVQDGTQFAAVNPAGKQQLDVVDLIEMEAYGYRVALSMIFRSIQTWTRAFEDQLRVSFSGEESLGSDLLIRLSMSFEP